MTAFHRPLAAVIAEPCIPLTADMAEQSSTITASLARLSAGDLPADAVREERCLKAPVGCGLPLIDDGVARVFWSGGEAQRYLEEWRITGLCPDCQDALDSGDCDE
jgi:hypothetical protein